MTEKDILSLVNEFLTVQDFFCRRIDTNILPEGKKAPDFEVLRDNDFSFLAEVKTPIHQTNPTTNMFHWTTMHSKIRGCIHKAHKQFESWDDTHRAPRVVIFTSQHFQLHWKNMLDNIRGYVSGGDTMIRDLRTQRYITETDDEIRTMDVILWMQISEAGRLYQLTPFLNANSMHLDRIRQIAKFLRPHDTSIKGQVIEFEWKEPK